MSTVSCAEASWLERRAAAKNNSHAHFAACTAGVSRRFNAALYGGGGRPSLCDTNKLLPAEIEIATLNLTFADSLPACLSFRR